MESNTSESRVGPNAKRDARYVEWPPSAPSGRCRRGDTDLLMRCLLCFVQVEQLQNSCNLPQDAKIKCPPKVKTKEGWLWMSVIESHIKNYCAFNKIHWNSQHWRSECPCIYTYTYISIYIYIELAHEPRRGTPPKIEQLLRKQWQMKQSNTCIFQAIFDPNTCLCI